MAEPRPQYDLTLALFTLALINLGVYVLWQTWGFENYALMERHFLVSAESVSDLRLWTLITTMFSHNDPMHLFFNLFALWMFGSAIEEVVGPLKFALLYLFGGLAASIGFVAWGVFTGSSAAALGASGSIMALAALYGMWFPNRVFMFNFLIPMPAWIMVLLFIGMDLLGMLGGGSDQNVAYAAHLGGAVFGLAVGLPRFLRGRRS